MKKITASISLFICIICLTSCGNAQSTSGSTDTLPEQGSEYVTAAPGVTYDMNSAGYWIAKCDDADTVLMEPVEIMQINAENEPTFAVGGNNEIKLSGIGDSIDGAYVKALLDGYTPPAVYYAAGEETSDAYWDGIIENIDRPAVGDTVSVSFGFTVKRTDVKAAPTSDFISDSADDLHYDMNAVAECAPYEPVAVLHKSKDKSWYYIAAYGYAGWVPAEDIALCGTREEWAEAQNPDEFLVVTGREIRLAYDPYDPDTSGQLIPMGTELTLVKPEDAPADFNGRTSYNSYIVKVPSRLNNGMISYEYALIPVSDDVSIGYLPYTRANVLEQSFKRLGDRYGWAGMYSANDCSGITREIYACFGFEFPRNGKAQIRMTSMTSIDVSEMTDEEKMEILSELPAGSLLYFQGHLMMYLGMDDGTPYVISAVGSMATEEMAEGESLAVNSVVINSLTDTTRKNGETWLASVTNILTCEAE